MPEQDLEIPEEWQFPERKVEGIQVIQIDHKQRYLACNIPDPCNSPSSDELTDDEIESAIERHKMGNFVDYVFGWNGTTIGSRHHFSAIGSTKTYVTSVGSDIPRVYRLTSDLPGSFSSLEGSFQHSFYQDEKFEIANGLAGFIFIYEKKADSHFTYLTAVGLGTVFMERPTAEDRLIKSPVILL